ncbi:MAG: hypothetical protein K9M99_03700 [Candidatus Cloacimonetes bacterium]|nr:hypothetical protein [Candidatus Cloacimonadota bacterium]
MKGYYLISYEINDYVNGIEGLIKGVEEGLEGYKHVRINASTWIIKVEGDMPGEHMGEEIHERVATFYHNVMITHGIIIRISEKDLLEAYHFTGKETEELILKLTKDQS